ncbi:MAG: DUF465 domain-containing protein [Bdellovibrionota bacterium]
MNKKEIEKVKELIEKGNYELGKLYEEHTKLDKRVEALSNKTFLSPKEEEEYKKAKMLKLQGKKRILEILKEAKD